VQISLLRISSIAIVGFALVSLAAPLDTNAQTSAPQWAQCLNRDNAYARDLQIGGCTAVIRSGQETQDKLALAFGQRGRAYSAQKEYANAIADFDQAGQLAPNDHIWQNSRCWWRAVANRELDVARAACDTALTLAPGNAAARDSRGLVGLRQGRFLDSWDDYDAAVRSTTANPWALFGRGVAALALGRSQEGQADIARATQLDAKIAQSYASFGVTPALRAPAASATAAQEQTVLLCRETSGTDPLASGIYRFNGSARWQQWSATEGRWEEMCGADRAKCYVSSTTYRAEWEKSDYRMEWVMDRRDGYLKVWTIGEENLWGSTAQCSPGQSP
jgi:tetratricopeptide (TPR) repeat protein